MDLYSRRTKPSTNSSNKLSLSTTNGPSSTGNPNDHAAPNSASILASASRNATIPLRYGGDSSSRGKANSSNSATTPGGRIMSPSGGASSAFGLGSGAFSSFGATAKTPKSPGNPFEPGFKSSPIAALGSEKSFATASRSVAGGVSGAAASAPGGAVGSRAVGSGAGSGAATGPANGAPRYTLRHEWVFWFRPPISKANGYIEYEKTLHQIATVGAVEEFFSVYSHLKRPSTLPLVSDYHLFRKGIRPIWEDQENRKGGKWIIRLKKGVADRYWEDLMFALVGDQFGETGDEVCGAVLSVRNGEDILSVWVRNDGGRVLRIRDTMKRALSLPANTNLEWKSHDASIQHRSAIEESRREKTGNHQYSNNNNNGSSSNNNNTNASSQQQHQYQQSDKRSGKQHYSSRGTGGEEQQHTYGHGTP